MDGPASRGRIRTPLPGCKTQYGAASRKGTPEDCEYRFPERCYRFSLSHHQIVELRMCALSNRLREKPNWWENVKDKAIVKEWREEALQQEEDGDEAASRKLTSAMVLKFRYL